eukprot:7128831-Pyramimonas_sp.AAC.1
MFDQFSLDEARFIASNLVASASSLAVCGCYVNVRGSNRTAVGSCRIENEKLVVKSGSRLDPLMESDRAQHSLLSLGDNCMFAGYGCTHKACANERVLTMMSNVVSFRGDHEHCVRAGLGELSSDGDI